MDFYNEETRRENSQLNEGISAPNLQDLAKAPNVFKFTDYREYLQEWFRWKKRINPKYSGALFARKSGFSAHTLFGMVVRGQRNLTYSSMYGFLKALELKGKKAKYFEKMVYYNQAKTPEEKENFFNEMLEISKSNANSELIELKNYTEYLSSWHVGAIRELINFPDFQPDPVWITKKLKGKVSKKQVDSAWQILIDLSLIRFDESLKRYVNVNKAIEIDPRKTDFALLNFHKCMLQRTLDSVETGTRSEREVSSLTISVSVSQVEKIKEKINQFRKEINKELSNSTDEPEVVVALNCQLVELTTRGDKGESNV